MILMIDNYDSFTYNVVQLISKLGYTVKTVRNDEITIKEIEKLKPSHIVISPGPGYPKDAGISLKVIKYFAGKIPILGVCLGHQCIIEAFGGKIISAGKIVHGKTSKIIHDSKGLFRNIPQSLDVVRYHSLAGDPEAMPECLETTAQTEDGTIMGVRHKDYQIVGVQFHPESIGTQKGEEIMKNFFHYRSEEAQAVKLITKVSRDENLDAKESYHMMDEITSGELADSQLGTFLGALAVKGITPVELSSFVQLLRDKAGVKTSIRGALDTCGTGGDGKHTFNISTAAALLCAFSGIKVAKHGNRAISSKSGSFDFLNSLGINTQGDIVENIKSLNKNNFAFFFAPNYHSAMKYVAKVRQEIKIRTVFNMIGPLANPLALDYQLVGIFDPKLLDLFAESMKRLGRKHAMVVHSTDGLDEISISAKTLVKELMRDGTIISYEINPADFGIKNYKLSDIEGASANDNVELFYKIISGKKLTHKETAVKIAIALNAGAAMYICELSPTIKDGYKLALKKIEDKKFILYLNHLKNS
ncbi:MAG: bifunctional anthranilate synthase component II/anthranilate phosphoribosyltransferase [Candidatus Omnitrophica bacterium]|nr:bifunctional anthranilate synthase component II/anthranilate phosphoribosyltransferase [Candidatus Omnitrophota bacterium]